MRDAVRVHVDADDAVLVVDITSRSAAWHNLVERVEAWIKANL